MSTGALKHRYTPEEYLALERKAEFRSEYHQGQIYAMSGASWVHNQVSAGLNLALGSRLAGGPCQPVSSDMRVVIPSSGLYT